MSIVIEHIAVSYGDDEARAQRFLDFVADVLERTLGPKGYR